ncbi:SRPBCC family protein [Lacicoccus qingdaonensis]|uniref:Polyketide cyclase / dehydrase and lipid transport n=1 Tax=Lacicoccus qingdaonensis TaxID=576118 RepID=A0A1G9B8J3_9BACL|nr:SRPBCC family protein [Salinicoccus qingdaonensis]SDK35788.1 Polyketide cyclase / dehydrase and lipid transport [Salinicoccus qingdaonensis]
MEIYNYQKQDVEATPERVFEFVNDDAKLQEIFSILDNIEYSSTDKRDEGTKFRTTLNVKGKTYRFRSEIIEYEADRRVTVRSRLKQGDILTQFTVVPNNGGVDISVRSELRNSKMGAKVLVTTMKPVVGIVMNRELNKFIDHVEK